MAKNCCGISMLNSEGVALSTKRFIGTSAMLSANAVGSHGVGTLPPAQDDIVRAVVEVKRKRRRPDAVAASLVTSCGCGDLSAAAV